MEHEIEIQTGIDGSALVRVDGGKVIRIGGKHGVWWIIQRIVEAITVQEYMARTH